MKNTLKVLMLATALFGFSDVAEAAQDELSVSADEEKDLMTMIDESAKMTPSLRPCFESEMKEGADKYQVYNKCICQNNNTAVIASLNKINSIYAKHPEWSSYPKVKVQRGMKSMGVNVEEFKRMIDSVKDCLN